MPWYRSATRRHLTWGAPHRSTDVRRCLSELGVEVSDRVVTFETKDLRVFSQHHLSRVLEAFGAELF